MISRTQPQRFLPGGLAHSLNISSGKKILFLTENVAIRVDSCTALASLIVASYDFFQRITVVVVVVAGLGGRVEACSKGLPARSWHWQALPQTNFFQIVIVVDVVVAGLGVWVEACSKGLPAGSWHWQALPQTNFCYENCCFGSRRCWAWGLG